MIKRGKWAAKGDGGYSGWWGFWGFAAELARGLKAEALITTYSHSRIMGYDRQTSLGAFCPQAIQRQKGYIYKSIGLSKIESNRTLPVECGFDIRASQKPVI